MIVVPTRAKGSTGPLYIDDIGFYHTKPIVPRKGEFQSIVTQGIVGDGKSILIGGFVVTQASEVLIRGIGPELIGRNGLTTLGVLLDPKIELVYPDGVTRVVNDNVENLADSLFGMVELMEGTKSSEILIDLLPGEYTVLLSGNNGSTGVALIEISIFKRGYL